MISKPYFIILESLEHFMAYDFPERGTRAKALKIQKNKTSNTKRSVSDEKQ